MSMLVVRSERLVLRDGIRAAALHIRDGRIAAIAGHAECPAGAPLLDVGELMVLPGLVDTHVHVNDPGRADWEGFEHATRAAAAGGVTTIVDMPLNSRPATTSVEGLVAKRAAAEGRCHVDVGFWGGVVPGNAPALEPLASAGVLGFKCFLCPSGVDEFQHVTESDLRGALPVLARLALPLLVHAELPDRLEPAPTGADPRRYATWLHTRPRASEQAAVEMLVRLSREFGVHVHVVHLASADALPVLRAARRAGCQVTVETCPHYLTFAAEEIEDGQTAFKCAPPIRERENREALWTGLVEGDIDVIATDHSPAPPAMKRLVDGDFLQAWGGIASLQLGLSAVWTEARRRDVTVALLARWLSEAPAQLAGLKGRKGSIAEGADADLVVWDADAQWTVEPHALEHRHPITPYAGLTLRGRAVRTLVRGATVFEEGTFARTKAGRLLTFD
jgi:allantoinase